MPKIGINLGQANVDIEATRGSDTDTLVSTTHTPLAAPPGSGPVQYLKTGGRTTGAQGSSVSYIPLTNGTKARCTPLAPTVKEFIPIWSLPSATRVNSNFTDNSVTAEMYVGGTAIIYGADAGVGVASGPFDIVGGNFGTWIAESTAAATVAYDGTGFKHRVRFWSQPSTSYWFGVAAIGADSLIGAVGYDEYVMPSEVGASALQDNSAAEVALGFTPGPGGSAAAPANVTATMIGAIGGEILVTHDPVPGALGYLPFISYSDPATHPAEPYLELEAAASGIATVGDVLAVTHRITEVTPTMVSKRVATLYNNALGEPWQRDNPRNADPTKYVTSHIEFDESDLAPDISYGAEFMRVTVPAGGGGNPIYNYWCQGTGGDFYGQVYIGQTWRMIMRLRASKAFPVTATIQANGISGINVVSATWNLTTAWQIFTLDHVIQTDPPTTSSPYAIIFNIDGSAEGSPFYVDIGNNAVPEMSGESGGVNQIEPWIMEELTGRDWVPRDHSLIKKAGAGKTVSFNGIVGGTGTGDRRSTLYDTFASAKAAGCSRVWPQWEALTFSDAENINILAYITATVASGHPMALLRQSQGQTAPWVDEFDEILLEPGNEMWQPANAVDFFGWPSGFTDRDNATVYSIGESCGLIQHRLISVLKASGYWNSKIIPVIGGRRTNSWTTDILTTFRHSPALAVIQLYLFGWEGGTRLIIDANVPADLQKLALVVPNDIVIAVDDFKARAEADAVAGTDLAIYEAAQGYLFNGLNGAITSAAENIRQENGMKSATGALAVAASWLYAWSQGIKHVNFFLLAGKGNAWTVASPESDGGGYNPAWQIVKLIQGATGAAADVAAATVTRGVGIAYLDSGNVAGTAETFFAYSVRPTATPTRELLIVGNQNTSTSATLTVRTAWASASSAQFVRTGSNPAATNRYPVGKVKASTPTIYGAGQTGTSIISANWSWNPVAGEVHTIEGSDYTVASISGFDRSIDDRSDIGTVVYTTSVSVAPANGAVITSDAVDVDGYAPDTNSIAIDYAWASMTVPADMSAIQFTLGPGELFLLLLDGVA